MSPLFLHFADDTSGLAALGLNGQAFLIQVATFIVAFAILRQWAFKPIIRKLDERRALIDKGVSLGEEMQAKAAKFDADIADKLHQAREQADKIVTEAHDDAQRIAQDAEAVARRQTDAMMQSAHKQIKLTTEHERAKLEAELVGLVSQVSESVIGEKLDPRKDTALIERSIKEREPA